MSNGGIDPIFASVLQKRLHGITEEMALTILMTAKSPVIFSARDCCTGLYDEKGRMWEQTEYLPQLAMSIAPPLCFTIDCFGGEVFPGDVILVNDPYCRNNQLNDMCCFKPIFFDGELIGWAGTKAHQADLGGQYPGSFNPHAEEIWQEALRVPPVKVYEKGKLRKDVWNLINYNTRWDMVEWDINTTIGGATIGERRVIKLLEKYGVDKFRKHVNHILDSTEQMMREEIRKIPNGIYYGESYMDYDGVREGMKHKCALMVTVEDEQITFDFTGTDPQVPSFANSVFTNSYGSTMLSFFNFVNPAIPHNDGALRPVKVIIPEGTYLNARFPAATTFGNYLVDEIFAAMSKALAQAIPKKISGGWCFMNCSMYSGIDKRKNQPFFDCTFMEYKNGGAGGTYGVDGYPCIGAIIGLGGALAHDPEVRENVNPDLVIHYEYEKDSEGAGEWRGAPAGRSVARFDGEGIAASIFSQGWDVGAFGLFGGEDTAPNWIKITYPDGREYFPKNKEVVRKLDGAIWEQHTSGGGGFGDPFRRAIDAVVQDVKDDLVSIEKARSVYGVAIDPETFEVDLPETRKIRSSRPLAKYPWE